MAKSACIEKLCCPDCQTQPNTHLQTYLNVDEALGIEWYTSFCHGECWENKGDPYAGNKAPEKKVKSDAELREETEDVRLCKLFNPKGGYRGIPAKHYKSFSVRLLLSEYDGKTPVGVAFPYSDYGKLTGWKARLFKLIKGKKVMYGIGKTANADPFGLARAMTIESDTLWITEGEFDAIALDYCLVTVGDKSKYPVVSLTSGGGSLEKNFDYIESRVRNKYKHIVLVLDDDLVGQEAIQTAYDLWGDKVRTVRMPKNCKDSNDAVKADKTEEMGNNALNHERYSQ